MRRSSLFAALFLLVHTVSGQSSWEQTRDSLLKALSRTPEDSNAAMTMIYLGAQYEYNQQDSALYFLRKAYELSRRTYFVRGIVNGLSLQAGILASRDDLDSAIALDSEALVISQKADYQKGLASVYNNIAILYDNKGDRVRSVDYYLRAIAMDEQFHDDRNLATAYSNIGGVYDNLKEYDKGYSFSLKGIALGRQLQDKDALESGYLNLSSALIRMNRADTAIAVLEDVVRLAQTYKDNDIADGALDNICAIYVDRERWGLLKENAEKLLAFARSVKEEQGIFLGLIRLFDYYWAMKDHTRAAACIREAIGRASAEGVRKNLGNAYEKASLLELVEGHVKVYNRYRTMKDSIDELLLSDRIVRNTQELEARYALNKKQAEIDELNNEEQTQALLLRQQHLLNWVLAGMVLAVILAAVLYYRYYRQKKKELEREKQLFAVQAVLQGQVEERSRLAKDLHDGLGSILSGAKYSFTNMKENLIITPEAAAAFERSMGMLDKSIHELRRVAHNMMPEALMKFGLDSALRDFCDSIDQSGAVKLTYLSYYIDESTIPETRAAAVYRIVQELVNNVLKHAGARTALVQVIRKEKALSISVEDDGRGFDPTILEGSDGIGYLNLKHRVAWLNGTIDIHSTPGRGVSVNIEIPNIE